MGCLLLNGDICIPQCKIWQYKWYNLEEPKIKHIHSVCEKLILDSSHLSHNIEKSSLKITYEGVESHQELGKLALGDHLLNAVNTVQVVGVSPSSV